MPLPVGDRPFDVLAAQFAADQFEAAPTSASNLGLLEYDDRLRYCAWPTQASSYLTGPLEIARLRDRWQGEGRGPLREFHDRLAGSERLPVSLVERVLFG